MLLGMVVWKFSYRSSNVPIHSNAHSGSQNPSRRKGHTKTAHNIRLFHTKFCRPSNQKPTTCAPLICITPLQWLQCSLTATQSYGSCGPLPSLLPYISDLRLHTEGSSHLWKSWFGHLWKV